MNDKALDLKARLDGGDLSVQGELDGLLQYDGVSRLVQLPVEILRVNKCYDSGEILPAGIPRWLANNM